LFIIASFGKKKRFDKIHLFVDFFLGILWSWSTLGFHSKQLYDLSSVRNLKFHHLQILPHFDPQVSRVEDMPTFLLD